MPTITPMLAHNYLKCMGKVIFPCMVQPKIDGVRLIWDGERAYSRTGKPLAGTDDVVRALESTCQGFPLDGELYHPKWTFEQISGTARRRGGSGLRYYVFDRPIVGTFATRSWSILQHVRDFVAQLVCVPTITTIIDHGEIEQWHETFVAEGYEGCMVRNYNSAYKHSRSYDLLKYKKFMETVGYVIDTTLGKGKHIGKLGALRVSIPSGQTVDVGTGFTDSEREIFWLDPPREIRLKYQELTKAGVPRFPVFVGVINGSHA